MIAVEALLSDDEKELTHKLSLRLAALCRAFHPSRAAQLFAEMKRIYDCRSKSVHGGGYAADYKAIQSQAGNIGVIYAALEHLRNARAVLIMNPAFLESKKVDEFPLTGASSVAATSADQSTIPD